jgi:hypothetical protein
MTLDIVYLEIVVYIFMIEANIKLVGNYRKISKSNSDKDGKK